MATAAAAELPKLGLADALALLLLYRWHGRLCLEAGGLSPADAALALAALGEAEPGPPALALGELPRRTGSRAKQT